MRPWFLLFLFCGLVSACSGDLRLTVLYDGARGLKPGDPVLWKDTAIGKVKAVEVSPRGRFAVRLQIEQDFRQAVTDQSRFLIQTDLAREEHGFVEMVRLAEGGAPLSDGAEIEGSSSLSVLLEHGGRELQAWSKRLQDELERFERELRQLPDKEWYQELERQMDEWARQLEQAGEEFRRSFRRDVLPALEEALRELRRRFEEQGREEEVQPLEKRLDELRTI